MVYSPVIPLFSRLLKASFLGERWGVWGVCGVCWMRSWCTGAEGGRGTARSSGERRGGVLLRLSSADRFYERKVLVRTLYVRNK